MTLDACCDSLRHGALVFSTDVLLSIPVTHEALNCTDESFKMCWGKKGKKKKKPSHPHDDALNICLFWTTSFTSKCLNQSEWMHQKQQNDISRMPGIKSSIYSLWRRMTERWTLQRSTQKWPWLESRAEWKAEHFQACIFRFSQPAMSNSFQHWLQH